jgi:hypothetical protein
MNPRILFFDTTQPGLTQKEKVNEYSKKVKRNILFQESKPKRKKKRKGWQGISCHLPSIQNSRGLKTDPRDPWPHILFSIWGLSLHQRTERAPFHGLRVFSQPIR